MKEKLDFPCSSLEMAALLSLERVALGEKKEKLHWKMRWDKAVNNSVLERICGFLLRPEWGGVEVAITKPAWCYGCTWTFLQVSLQGVLTSHFTCYLAIHSFCIQNLFKTPNTTKTRVWRQLQFSSSVYAVPLSFHTLNACLFFFKLHSPQNKRWYF